MVKNLILMVLVFISISSAAMAQSPTDRDPRKVAASVQAIVQLLLLDDEEPMNLIKNGDFETGDLSHWDLSGQDAGLLTSGVFNSSGSFGNGLFRAAVNSFGPATALTQSVELSLSQPEELRFSMEIFDTPNNGNAFVQITHGETSILESVGQERFPEIIFSVAEGHHEVKVSIIDAGGSNLAFDDVSLTFVSN